MTRPSRPAKTHASHDAHMPPLRERKPHTRTSRAGLGGQDLERDRPGVCVEGGGSAYGEPLVAKSPELGFIPTQPPFKGGALAPLVVSASFARLRVWEVGWGNVPLDFCGVLVRESRAIWLAGAR
jgi:hypothetical protein